MYDNLIFDETSVYELDEECLKHKQNNWNPRFSDTTLQIFEKKRINFEKKRIIYILLGIISVGKIFHSISGEKK